MTTVMSITFINKEFNRGSGGLIPIGITVQQVIFKCRKMFEFCIIARFVKFSCTQIAYGSKLPIIFYAVKFSCFTVSINAKIEKLRKGSWSNFLYATVVVPPTVSLSN